MTLTALLVTELLEIRVPVRGSAHLRTALHESGADVERGGTYIYCMDEYAFALFAAAAAAWCFTRGRWWTLAGLGMLVASLAVYQPYFTVAAALCMLVIFRRTAAGDPAKQLLLTGIRYLGLLAAGLCALLRRLDRRVRRPERGQASGGGVGAGGRYA